MENNINLHDVLLLVINSSNDGIEEYQDYLCEAATLGIDQVRYIGAYEDDDLDDFNDKTVSTAIKKLNRVCEELNMEITGEFANVCFSGPFLEKARIIKVDDNGTIHGKIIGEAFDLYKKKYLEISCNNRDIPKMNVKARMV